MAEIAITADRGVGRAVPGGAVTLHVWDLGSPRALPATLADVARLPRRRPAGASFLKVLGTASGSSFAARDVTPLRWAQITVWDDAAAAGRWERSAAFARRRAGSLAMLRLDLSPVRVRGRWSGRAPFPPPADRPADAPVLVVTRARLRPRRARAFRAAVPDVARSLGRAPGLLFAMAVGEAPIALAGTLSVWRSTPAMQQFARDSVAHRGVVRATPQQRWYAEELFARFAIDRFAGELPDLAEATLTGAGIATVGRPR